MIIKPWSMGKGRGRADVCEFISQKAGFEILLWPLASEDNSFEDSLECYQLRKFTLKYDQKHIKKFLGWVIGLRVGKCERQRNCIMQDIGCNQHRDFAFQCLPLWHYQQNWMNRIPRLSEPHSDFANIMNQCSAYPMNCWGEKVLFLSPLPPAIGDDVLIQFTFVCRKDPATKTNSQSFPSQITRANVLAHN